MTENAARDPEMAEQQDMPQPISDTVSERAQSGASDNMKLENQTSSFHETSEGHTGASDNIKMENQTSSFHGTPDGHTASSDNIKMENQTSFHDKSGGHTDDSDKIKMEDETSSFHDTSGGHTGAGNRNTQLLFFARDIAHNILRGEVNHLLPPNFTVQTNISGLNPNVPENRREMKRKTEQSPTLAKKQRITFSFGCKTPTGRPGAFYPEGHTGASDNIKMDNETSSFHDNSEGHTAASDNIKMENQTSFHDKLEGHTGASDNIKMENQTSSFHDKSERHTGTGNKHSQLSFLAHDIAHNILRGEVNHLLPPNFTVQTSIPGLGPHVPENRREMKRKTEQSPTLTKKQRISFSFGCNTPAGRPGAFHQEGLTGASDNIKVEDETSFHDKSEGLTGASDDVKMENEKSSFHDTSGGHTGNRNTQLVFFPRVISHKFLRGEVNPLLSPNLTVQTNIPGLNSHASENRREMKRKTEQSPTLPKKQRISFSFGCHTPAGGPGAFHQPSSEILNKNISPSGRDMKRKTDQSPMLAKKQRIGILFKSDVTDKAEEGSPSRKMKREAAQISMGDVKQENGLQFAYGFQKSSDNSRGNQKKMKLKDSLSPKPTPIPVSSLKMVTDALKNANQTIPSPKISDEVSFLPVDNSKDGQNITKLETLSPTPTRIHHNTLRLLTYGSNTTGQKIPPPRISYDSSLRGHKTKKRSGFSPTPMIIPRSALQLITESLNNTEQTMSSAKNTDKVNLLPKESRKRDQKKMAKLRIAVLPPPVTNPRNILHLITDALKNRQQKPSPKFPGKSNLLTRSSYSESSLLIISRSASDLLESGELLLSRSSVTMTAAVAAEVLPVPAACCVGDDSWCEQDEKQQHRPLGISSNMCYETQSRHTRSLQECQRPMFNMNWEFHVGSIMKNERPSRQPMDSTNRKYNRFVKNCLISRVDCTTTIEELLSQMETVVEMSSSDEQNPHSGGESRQ